MSPKRILAVAPVSAYGGHNTSVHRIRALEAMGHEVTVIDSRSHTLGVIDRSRSKLFRAGLSVTGGDPTDVNQRFLHAAAEGPWGIVWLEKAMTVDAQTLKVAKELNPSAIVVGYSPDDMNARHNQSQQFLTALPFYDFFLTTKSYNVRELEALGCRHGIFVGNAYDPGLFRPVLVSEEERQRLGGDIGFVGTFERDRAGSLLRLARAGFSVRVWGGSWERLKERAPNLRMEYKPLFGDEYARACASFKINLCFLRKMNRDRQTTRSIEIPACGAFMLAERSDEHLELFHEGIEAEFFSSDEELLVKCEKYLDNDAERCAIAAAGLARCRGSGYDNQSRLVSAFQRIEELSGQRLRP